MNRFLLGVVLLLPWSSLAGDPLHWDVHVTQGAKDTRYAVETSLDGGTTLTLEVPKSPQLWRCTAEFTEPLIDSDMTTGFVALACVGSQGQVVRTTGASCTSLTPSFAAKSSAPMANMIMALTTGMARLSLGSGSKNGPSGEIQIWAECAKSSLPLNTASPAEPKEQPKRRLRADCEPESLRKKSADNQRKYLSCVSAARSRIRTALNTDCQAYATGGDVAAGAMSGFAGKGAEFQNRLDRRLERETEACRYNAQGRAQSAQIELGMCGDRSEVATREEALLLENCRESPWSQNPEGAKASEPEGDSELTGAEVQEVAATHRLALSKCVTDYRRESPGTTGTLVMRWTIWTDGSTSDIEVVSEALAGTSLAHCVEGLITNWSFPKRKKGHLATMPFTF